MVNHKGREKMKPVSKKADDTSVLSGKTMKELSKGDRVWQSKAASLEGKNSRGAKQQVKAAPLPSFVEPMKTKLVATPPSGNWIYEIKLDGWRALALKGGSLSRNEKDFGAKFPEVMDSIAELNVQDAMIDGEIVALDEKGRSSFQLLQAYDIGQQRPPIFFLRIRSTPTKWQRSEKLLGEAESNPSTVDQQASGCNSVFRGFRR